jgi:hypothetical protein
MSIRIRKFTRELRYAPESGNNSVIMDEYERGYRHAEDDIKRELMEIMAKDRLEKG